MIYHKWDCLPYFFQNTTFVNFDSSSEVALGMTSIDGTCGVLCGGYNYHFSDIRFINGDGIQNDGFIGMANLLILLTLKFPSWVMLLHMLLQESSVGNMTGFLLILMAHWQENHQAVRSSPGLTLLILASVLLTADLTKVLQMAPSVVIRQWSFLVSLLASMLPLSHVTLAAPMAAMKT